jgi:PAS domain S-box-containing protein
LSCPECGETGTADVTRKSASDLHAVTMEDDDTDDPPAPPPQGGHSGKPLAAEGAERSLTPSLIRVLGRVLDTIPAQINVKDSERRYIFVNRFLYEYYGEQPTTVLGKTAEEIMPPDEAEAVRQSDLQVLETGRPTGMQELEDDDLEDRRHHWLIGKWPLLGPGGKATNIITVAFDITELHDAREASAERVRMMQRVTSQAPLILLKTVLWPDGTVTIPFLEGRLVGEFPIDRAMVEEDASLLTQVIHPDDRQNVIDAWNQAAQQGRRFTCEFRAFTRLGEERWLSANASQRREDDGRIIVDEVIVDITELRAARQLAEESEEQLLSLARNVPGLIARCVTRPDGSSVIPFISGDFIETLQIDPEEVRHDGAMAWKALAPEENEALSQAWERSLATFTPFEHTFRCIDPQGETIWIRTRSRHRRQDNGDIVSDTLCIDITDEKRAELELQRERELFQSIASHLPGLIFRRTIAPDGTSRYDYIQGALLDRLAVDRAKVAASPDLLWQHFNSATDACVGPTMAEGIARLEPYRMLLRCRPVDSHDDMFVEVTSTPHQSQAGIVIDGIAVDVTARVAAENEAREQRMLLQQVIDAVPAAINVKDAQGRIELANRTLADYYGVTPAELLWDAGLDIKDSPHDDAQTREWDAWVLQSGAVSDAREYAYIDSEGRTRHWLGKKSPLHNPATGKADRIVTVSLDVSDRVMAEERARQHVEQLRSVAASIPGAILRWHRQDNHITQEFAAGQFVENRQIDGTSTGGAIGDLWPSLMAEDAEALDRALGDPGATRGVLEDELRMRVGDETRWVKLFGSHRTNGHGGPAWDIIVLDATESKRYEEQLGIAQKMDAIGNLTGGIAHDFNNVLAVVVANLDLLLDMGLPDEEAREITNSALRAAERGAELTGRLLAFARSQPTEPRVFDCGAQIEGLISFLHRSLGPEITLDLRRSATPAPVDVDPGQFENALMNLMVNARDAMDGRGHIVVESTPVILEAADHLPASLAPGHYAVVTVSDNGSGMSPEVQRRAFEPLFTTKSQGRGTGFGLPMVYNFARQAGGLITLYSEPGHGTTARLYLPLSNSAKEKPKEAGGAEASFPVSRGELCVLLVDDNADARKALARQLARQGFLVAEAENASQALALAEHEEVIDLLITDVIMPGALNGAELADRLRESRPDLPTLLTTGYSADVLAERKLARGDYELLSKPFRESELLAAVARLLEKRQA